MENEPYRLLQDLAIGVGDTIKVMICRKWDAITPKGFHISSDFLVSDETGNLLHCFAKSNIAHRFVGRLQEGHVYLLKTYHVLPRPESYCVLKDKDFVVEFDGETIVTDSSTSSEANGYTRYPFHFVEFEDITDTNQRYLIDVIGCVAKLGNISPPTPGKSSKKMEVKLINGRGRVLTITLWKGFVDDFMRRHKNDGSLHILALTSMNVKSFNGQLSVSTSSATLLYDMDSVPAVSEYRKCFMESNPSAEMKDILNTVESTSIAELLLYGREKKEQMRTFSIKAKISDVRTKNSWYYLACTSLKCWKRVTRQDGQYWCETCEQHVTSPIPRFKLQVVVQDSSSQVVMGLFDETVKCLINATASELLDSKNEEAAGLTQTPLPTVITELIGSTYVFETKASTYFRFGGFESFTCKKVEKLRQNVMKESPVGKLLAAIGETRGQDGVMSTPAKKELPKRKLEEESDEENTIAEIAQSLKKDVKKGKRISEGSCSILKEVKKEKM